MKHGLYCQMSCLACVLLPLWPTTPNDLCAREGYHQDIHGICVGRRVELVRCGAVRCML